MCDSMHKHHNVSYQKYKSSEAAFIVLYMMEVYFYTSKKSCDLKSIIGIQHKEQMLHFPYCFKNYKM